MNLAERDWQRRLDTIFLRSPDRTRDVPEDRLNNIGSRCLPPLSPYQALAVYCYARFVT